VTIPKLLLPFVRVPPKKVGRMKVRPLEFDISDELLPWRVNRRHGPQYSNEAMNFSMWIAAPYFDLGCLGGDFEGGMQYIIDHGGITLEEDYPYLAEDSKCNHKKAHHRVPPPPPLSFQSRIVHNIQPSISRTGFR